MAEIPKVQLLDPDATGGMYGQTPLATVSMTDSTNTWETLTLSYTEPTRSRMLILRVRATHTSGSLYFAHTVLTAGGGMAAPDGWCQ